MEDGSGDHLHSCASSWCGSTGFPEATSRTAACISTVRDYSCISRLQDHTFAPALSSAKRWAPNGRRPICSTKVGSKSVIYSLCRTMIGRPFDWRKQTSGLILLYFEENSALVFPKRCFTSPQQLSSARAIIAAPRSVTNPRRVTDSSRDKLDCFRYTTAGFTTSGAGCSP